MEREEGFKSGDVIEENKIAKHSAGVEKSSSRVCITSGTEDSNWASSDLTRERGCGTGSGASARALPFSALLKPGPLSVRPAATAAPLASSQQSN